MSGGSIYMERNKHVTIYTQTHNESDRLIIDNNSVTADIDIYR